MMKFGRVEITGGMLLFAFLAACIASVAGLIGMAAWDSSEKAAAYKAYVGCLHEMKDQAVDVKQTFCGRIREQL